MKHEAEWRYQIGELMIRFAEIESYIAGLLVCLPEENKFEKLKNEKFNKRCSVVINAAKSSSINKETIKTIVSCINQAMRLSETRNLIAHNPINLSLESIFDDNLRHEIRSYKNNDKYIELDELKDTVSKIQTCSNMLYEALSSTESEIYA